VICFRNWKCFVDFDLLLADFVFHRSWNMQVEIAIRARCLNDWFGPSAFIIVQRSWGNLPGEKASLRSNR
jgi:hypothetical protein